MIKIKKLIIILSLLLLCGCQVKKINDLSVDEIINNNVGIVTNNTNVYNLGYKFYLPRGFRVQTNNIYNLVLISNGMKYYINIDLIAYFNKSKLDYHPSEKVYYYKSFSNEGIDGYIEIKNKNDKYYMTILYNYASIEVISNSYEINYVLINSLNLLSSIKYNDKIVGNRLGDDILLQNETVYKIPQPENKTEKKDFLDYVEEYGDYKETVNSKETDDGYIKSE